MNAQELYEEIKSFLKYVDLPFSQMEKVTVVIPRPGVIVLSYGRVRTELQVG